MQTLLSLCGLTLVVWLLGGLLVRRAWRALQTGQVGVRGAVFNRSQQPGAFYLIVALYGFGAAALIGWGLLMMGLMGVYAVEMAVGGP